MILATWLHVVAAVAWIGGMLFLSLVLVPVIRREGFAGERVTLFQSLALRFRLVVWASVVTLVATGSMLLASRPESLAEPVGWPFVLKLKLTLAAVLIVLTAGHDFWLGPKAAGLMRRPSVDRSQTEQRLIRVSPWIARPGLLLALIVLLLGVVVART